MLRQRLPGFVAAVVAVLLCALPLGAQEAPQPSVAGIWSGTIEVPATPLEVIVTLAAGDDGAWSGTIDIPVQQIAAFPLIDIEIEGDSVIFGISRIPGQPTFDGRLSADGETLAGTFRQAGGELAFSLTRGEPETGGLDPKEALADFTALVERSLTELNVPGVGVAIYAGGEVVLNQGFGHRDVENDRPVTAETLFAIGSTTKAMTAAIVGTLVDDGQVEWDEPVRRYLPEFRLHDEVATERLTVRDLLTHRSGLPRHDFAWYGSDLGRDELLSTLAHLEPTLDLRQGFQYQNLMYLTAGVLSERVTGKSWETLVRERLFEPLGMTESDFSVARLASAENAAIGYRPIEDDTDVEPIAYRAIDAMGPAGSVNSNVSELIEWAAFQLGDGAIGGESILSTDTLAQLHAPQVVMPSLFGELIPPESMPYQLYAHGWMILPYRGHHVLIHGGGIDGFTASVAFLPFEEVAIVVLSNRQGTLLPNVLTLSAIDRLVGDEPLDWVGKAKLLEEQVRQLADRATPEEPVEGTSPAHALDTYTGVFEHPGYGQLSIERRGADGLKLTYHGIDLDLAHWHFETFTTDGGLFDGSKVTFLTSVAGEVDKVLAPFEPNLPAITFERAADPSLMDEERLAKFSGTFGNDALEITFSLRDDGKLRAAVVGQRTTTLVPLSETEFRVEELEGYRVRFVLEDGIPVSVDLIQPGGSLNLPKLAGE